MHSFYHLSRKEIDIKKWDNCIVNSNNSLIYAHSFFLDHIAPNWSALTNNNYDWVLPIISNRKWGISYLYQPVFTQQLGIYSHPNAEVPYHQIETWLTKHFRFWEISVNEQTAAHFINNKIIKTVATNYIIRLSKKYAEISCHYHNDLVKNLKKSSQYHVEYKPLQDFEQSLQLYINHYAERTPGVTSKDYEKFKQLCLYAKDNHRFVCRAATNLNGHILSSAILLSDGKRLYNMMNTTTQEGRKVSSNHFLINAIINEFAETDFTFDFEGSDLHGVQSFYANFGAQNIPYFHLKYNNLPWPIHLIKN